MEYKTSINLAGVELEKSGDDGLRNLRIRRANTENLYDLGELGAVVTKGVANVPWPGNPTPRIAENEERHAERHRTSESGHGRVCWSGISRFLSRFDTKIIVNVCGKTTEDYLRRGGAPGRRGRGYAGDQCFLPQCEGGRHRLRPEAGGRWRPSQRQ